MEKKSETAEIYHLMLLFSQRAHRGFSLRQLSTVAKRSSLKPLKTKQKGIDILHDPLWNKGMAMTIPERDRLNLRGLVPPRVKTLQEQADRIMKHMRG